jgi:signal peptidase I
MDGNQATPASAWGASAPIAPTTAEPTDQPATPPVVHESRGESARSLIWEIVQTVLLTIAIFLAVRSVVQNFRVEGASMDPTLRTGQYLLINKVLYARADGTVLASAVTDRTPNDEPNYVFGGPERGDIIVFRAPGSPTRISSSA